MRIPFKCLKNLCKKYKLTHAILFISDAKDGHVVTYGTTVEACGQACDFGNKLKDALGWPQELRPEPSRVKLLKKRIAELESEVEELEETLNEIGGTEWS